MSFGDFLFRVSLGLRLRQGVGFGRCSGGVLERSLKGQGQGSGLAAVALDHPEGVGKMRDVEYERGCLSQCKCCCSITGNVDGVGELCEPCLQVVKQCPPKKRFMRATSGCYSAIRPRPILVKPTTSSSACIALDRLVEVALSPTGSSLHCTTSSETSSPGDDVDLAGHGRETPGSTAAENGVLPRSPYGYTSEGSSTTRMGSSHTCKKKPPKHQVPMVPASTQPPCKLPRYSLPLEAVQKLKRLSSLDPLPHPGAASKLGHGDHSKRFTPRFKSLLDISC